MDKLLKSKRFGFRLSEDLFDQAEEKAGLTPLAAIVRGLMEMFVDGVIEKEAIEKYQRKIKGVTR
ncbi:MAG: hypothetical protein ACYTEQ_09525 [Planctomycetota bacterium]